ncbi:glycoside hydrolase family 16 protein [Aeromicrobium sp. Root495]|uniref:glycoside hydrolase family 16 protein n=1 Tax=Aeromicrobium sp. Root495 TaxID=1736550 RepID=UPI001910BA92|nr:glycoside hydrolase family 16 protein [Aeromicrobium sp. Root495]
MSRFHDDFDQLDPEVWLPHYLPHWSSRAESAAAWDVAGSALVLSIPSEHPLWCPDTHAQPLRVSGVQSGCFSGPVGSTVGQQPFVQGQTVREEQPFWTGWAPHRGLIEVRARLELSHRSMASAWLVGLEDEPERCGEICVFEVFGDTVGDDGAAVGQGIHAFRDPGLTEAFDAPHHVLDVAEWHTYAVDWRDDRTVFLVDGVVTSIVHQSPTYPMQMILAVFDFPDRAVPDEPAHEPRLLVDRVVGH